MESGYTGSSAAFVELSLEESITSLLVESSSSLVPVGGYFASRRTIFLDKTWLDVNLPTMGVEARLCGG